MPIELLLVDDDNDFREDFCKVLSRHGYKVTTANDRESGMRERDSNKELRIALVDVIMPDTEKPPEESGIHLIKYISESIEMGREPASVMALTALDDHKALEMVARAKGNGFICKLWDIDKKIEVIRISKMWAERSSGFHTLLKSLELRNPYTAGHCNRVHDIALLIIQRLLSAEGNNFDLAACLSAAKIHDIGKIAVPDNILLAPRALTREERSFLSQHAQIGANAVKVFGVEFELVACIILFHHRWYNPDNENEMNDYPATGLDGKETARRKNEIPLEARVVAVADTLDALTNDRPYRFGLSVKVAKEKINESVGKQFDPDVVTALNQIEESELQQIIDGGRYNGKHLLYMEYNQVRITPSNLCSILKLLFDIQVPDGSAFNRMVFESYERDTQSKKSRIVFSGVDEELQIVEQFIHRQIIEQNTIKEEIASRKKKNVNVPDALMVSADLPWPVKVYMKPKK